MIGLIFILGCSDSSEETGSPNPRTAVTDRGSYQLSYLPLPDPIPLDEEFDIEIMVMETATGAHISEGVILESTAEMPTHGHGMVQEPVTSLMESGHFLSEGFLFHMAGSWELYIYVSETLEDGSTNIEQGTFEIECCS